MMARNRLFGVFVLVALLCAANPATLRAQDSGRSRQTNAAAGSYQRGFDEGYRLGLDKGRRNAQSGKRRNASDFKQFQRGGAATSQDADYARGFRDGFQRGFGETAGVVAVNNVTGQAPPDITPPDRTNSPGGRTVLSRGRGPADVPPPAGPARVGSPSYGPFPSGPPVLKRPNNGTYKYPGVSTGPGGWGAGRNRGYGAVGGYGGGRVPYSTTLVIELQTPLSSKHSREGDRFSALVVGPGQYAGSRVEGFIGRIERPGRFAGNAEMSLIFEGIIFPDGYAERIQAQVTDVMGYRGGYGGGSGGYGGYGGGYGGAPWGWGGHSGNTNHDANAEAGDEGQIVGKSSHGRDAAIIAGSTAAGAVLGKVLGSGTWVGAAIGAAAGGGIVALNRGRDIELDPGVQMQIQTGQGVRF